MKRKMFSLIFILSLVMTLFSTAAAARSISFDSVYQVPGKGYVALFDIKGEWRQDELWGFVSLPRNRQINMDCNFRDDGKVSCVIADGIGQYAGRMVKLVVYGYSFDVVIPPDVRRSALFESIRHVPGKGMLPSSEFGENGAKMTCGDSSSCLTTAKLIWTVTLWMTTTWFLV